MFERFVNLLKIHKTDIAIVAVGFIPVFSDYWSEFRDILPQGVYITGGILLGVAARIAMVYNLHERLKLRMKTKEKKNAGTSESD